MPKKSKTATKLADALLRQCSIANGEATAEASISTNGKTTSEASKSTKGESTADTSTPTPPNSLTKWPKLRNKVPDIFLHKPVDFAQHVHKLLSMGIKFNNPYLSRYYTKINCPTFNDHKALVQYLEKKKLPFNTFGNPSKRKMKVVIRGLRNDIDLSMLKSELKALSIPIIRLHKMQRFENVRDRPVLILAVVPYNEDGKKLLQLKNIMGHDVKMEPPKPKVKQCHRCQMWGHAQRYCHGQVKCVKCAGEHFSKKCERDPDKEPPKCANCGGEHTANYKKCPCCPDSNEHKQSQRLKQTLMGRPKKAGLVTLENCDNLYKNLAYASDFKKTNVVITF